MRRRKVITCFVLLASVFLLAFSGMALLARPAFAFLVCFSRTP